MEVLRLPWGHLHFRQDGPSGGMPVVLINSLGTDLRMWDGLLPHLPRQTRAIRMDKRGHGLSALATGPFGIADLAADVLALMDYLGVARSALVGCSIGGMVAQALAAARPDRVAALVLSSTAARIGTAELWRERISQVRSVGLAALSGGIMERWFGAAFRDGPECALWQTMLSRCDPDGYAACCAAIASADLSEGLARLAAPTLVIAGGEDGATPPELVLDMARRIPSARMEKLAGAGHLPAIEAPAVYGALMTDFLRKNRLA